MTARAEHEPFSDYANAPGVNFSSLKEMETSPLHYALKAGLVAAMLTEEEQEVLEMLSPKETIALALGRLLHLRVLEPSLYQALVISDDEWPGGWSKTEDRHSWSKSAKGTSPDGTYRPFAEWRAARESEGRIFCTRAAMTLHQRVHDAVRSHPVAAMYLSWPGQAEVSVYWQHPLELQCKSRIDWLGDGVILDLKSTRDIRPHDFARSAYRYRYHAQAAFYQDAIKALTGERRPYLIVAVEKSPPFDVVVMEVPDDALAAGRSMYQDWMLRVLECQERGEWPGVSLEQTVLELPAYAFDDMDDAKLIVGGKEIRL